MPLLLTAHYWFSMILNPIILSLFVSYEMKEKKCKRWEEEAFLDAFTSYRTLLVFIDFLMQFFNHFSTVKG